MNLPDDCTPADIDRANGSEEPPEMEEEAMLDETSECLALKRERDTLATAREKTEADIEALKSTLRSDEEQLKLWQKRLEDQRDLTIAAALDAGKYLVRAEKAEAERDALAAALEQERQKSSLDLVMGKLTDATLDDLELQDAIIADDQRMRAEAEARRRAEDAALVKPLVEALERVRERIGMALMGSAGVRIDWGHEVQRIDSALAPYRKEPK